VTEGVAVSACAVVDVVAAEAVAMKALLLEVHVMYHL
jgi:hypothetical protein